MSTSWNWRESSRLCMLFIFLSSLQITVYREKPVREVAIPACTVTVISMDRDACCHKHMAFWVKDEAIIRSQTHSSLHRLETTFPPLIGSTAFVKISHGNVENLKQAAQYTNACIVDVHVTLSHAKVNNQMRCGSRTAIYRLERCGVCVCAFMAHLFISVY